MKISIISTSHRKNSESMRISEIIKKIILKIDKDIKCYNLDMFKKKIPLWTSDKEKNCKFWDKEFKKISFELMASDGFIIIVPEYGGMATPNSKNLFRDSIFRLRRHFSDKILLIFNWGIPPRVLF